MFGFDHNTYAFWLQDVLDRGGYLRRHALLDLEAAGIAIYHACKLGDPNNSLVGQVADMGSTNDWQHVVFTETHEPDVAEYYQSIIAANFLEGTLEM